MDRDEAIKATRAGAIAACVSGIFTALVYGFAVLTNASGDDGVGYWNDHAILIDIGLIFLCAWFIYKKSRIAAVIMFSYFVFSKLYLGVKFGEFSGILLALVLIYFFGRAVWGAFVFHKIEKAENPEYKTSKKWIWFIVAPIGLVLALLLGFGTMTMTGFAPSTEVQSGSEINQRHIDKLVAENVITSRGDIQYFYSAGVLSVLEEGVFLTEDELIFYNRDVDGELSIYGMNYEDITDIKMIEKGDFWTDETYLVSSDDPELWIQISLSVENEGHVDFLKALRSETTDKIKED